MPPARKATVYDRMTEREFLEDIVRAVRKLYGGRALICHFSDSRKPFKGQWVGDAQAKGWPDLVIGIPATAEHGPRLLFLECKAERGKATPEQVAWVEFINALEVPHIAAAVVRPSDAKRVWAWIGVADAL